MDEVRDGTCSNDGSSPEGGASPAVGQKTEGKPSRRLGHCWWLPSLRVHSGRHAREQNGRDCKAARLLRQRAGQGHLWAFRGARVCRAAGCRDEKACRKETTLLEALLRHHEPDSRHLRSHSHSGCPGRAIDSEAAA